MSSWPHRHRQERAAATPSKLFAVLSVGLMIENALPAGTTHGNGNSTQIFFVHVGKTGGDSVSSVLQHVCGDFDKHVRFDRGRKSGTDVFTRSHTSKPCFGREVHLRPVSPVETIAPWRIIIGVRDPIAQLVSAFNWDRRTTKDMALQHQLYECFDTPDAFAHNLFEPTDSCGQRARIDCNSQPDWQRSYGLRSVHIST